MIQTDGRRPLVVRDVSAAFKLNGADSYHDAPLVVIKGIKVLFRKINSAEESVSIKQLIFSGHAWIWTAAGFSQSA